VNFLSNECAYSQQKEQKPHSRKFSIIKLIENMALFCHILDVCQEKNKILGKSSLIGY
jgi:hypothetical protein